MKILNKVEEFKSALIEAPFFYRLVILFTAGITLSFIQAPFNLWPLLFLCLSIFYVLFSQSKNNKQAFITAYVYALGYFTAGLYWIGNALLVEGNDYAWAYPLAVIGLPALLSLIPALFLTIFFILKPRKRWQHFLLFCAFLALAEWVRGYALTGFPWNLFGYTWLNIMPIAQISALMGPYGLNLLTILWGNALGLWLLYPSRRTSIITLNIALISFIATYAWGHYRLQNTVTVTYQNVSLQIIQPNITQNAKWDSSQLVKNFEKHIQLTVQKENTGQKNIIIWPETALPPAFINNAAVNERIYSVLGANDILLTGALNITKGANGTYNYHNALLLWSPEQRARQLYSKSHLVPFGEYIPFQKFIPLPTITSFSGFDKGEGTQTITVASTPSFSPLICYEIIFPHQSALNGDKRPDYILTITNDGWYGNSPGPYQHFAQSRFRAIERGVPVVRSANTGISGVIDPYGRIVIASKYGEEISLDSNLPPKTNAPTLYSKAGDYPFLAIIIIIIALRFKRR